MARRRFQAGGLALGLLAAGPAAAWQWFAAPFADAGVEVDDNRRLLPESDGTAFGTSVRAGGQFGWRSPTQELKFRPYASAQRYPGEELLDTETIFLGADWTSRFARGRFGLEASAFQFNSLSQTIGPLPVPGGGGGAVPPDEGAEPGPAGPEVPEPGLVSESLTNLLFSLSPFVEYSLTRQDNLRLTFSADRADNERGVDYAVDRLDGTWKHALTPARTLHGGLAFGRYDIDNGALVTNAVELSGGYEHAFSKRLRARGLIGAMYAMPEEAGGGLGGSEDTLDWMVEAEVAVRGRQLNANASFLRGLAPTAGRRSLLVRNELKLSGDWNFSPLQVARLGVRAIEEQQLEGAGDSRYYAEISAGYRWRFTRTLSAGLSYQFRWTDSAGPAALGNAVFANVYYDGASVLIRR